MKSIIILVLILVIILAVYILIFLAKKKAKEVTRDLFGTDDIRKSSTADEAGICDNAKIRECDDITPSAADCSDFPDFTYDEMKNRAEDACIVPACDRPE